ncbi:hypothetical protein ABLC45_16665 [Escherichia coli]|uniref:hypothetical protein n=1 Tax=Escherichia coli TaxID=562 RepID=UPI0036DF8625
MIYTTGTIAISGNTVTGTGTNFSAPLSLIRVGCTLIAIGNPVQIFTITEIKNGTELSVTPAANPAIAAGTKFSILLSDSISVDGLAQDVAEALRYFTGQESEIATAIEILNSFSGDIELESLLNALQNIQEETEKSTANAQQTEANREMTEAAAIRAEEAATSASGSATSASTSASTATTKASEALTSATNAADSATSARTSATNAENSASSASSSKDAAAASASAASASETKAKASETSAASSASSASASASTATTKASEAATSASDAAGSASAASTSATNAASSAAEAKNYLDQMTDVTIDLSKVSGVLDVAHGGTGVTSLDELKTALGITDFGTGGAGTSSNDYDLTETSFNFQNPTTGRLFVSYNNMTNFPNDSMLSAVVYTGDSEEYIDSVQASKAKCIIECTKVTDSAGMVAYSVVVTRCVPSLTPEDSNIARCYGYGKVSGTAISWAFRQDFW